MRKTTNTALIVISIMTTLAASGAAFANDLIDNAFEQVYEQAGIAVFQGRDGDAIPILLKARGIAKLEHDKIVSARDLANAYVKLKQDNLAEPLYRELIAIYERKINSDPGSTKSYRADELQYVDGLCGCLIAEKQFDEAELLAKQAVSFSNSVSPPGDERIPSHLWQLGTVYTKQGKYREAQTYLSRAVAMTEALPAESHGCSSPCVYYATLDTQEKKLRVATCLASLANAYRLDSKYKKADATFARALKLLNSCTIDDQDSRKQKRQLLEDYVSLLEKTGSRDKATQLKSALKRIRP